MTTKAPLADDGRARHLTPGLALPDLDLPSTSGDSVNLATLKGRSVLFVYPWTGRPGAANPPGWDEIPGAHGSTPEALGFNRLATAFAAMKTRVYGLSLQDTHFQREAVERLKLAFPLLSDASRALASALRLPTFKAGADDYLTRLSVIVRSGRIEKVFYPIDDPAVHPREVLGWLASEAGYAVEAGTAKKPGA